MELDVKKSKALKISVRILIGIILLSVGIAIGAHSGHYRNYANNGYGCGNFNRFERGDRQQGGRQFRMMVPQNNINPGYQIQAGSAQAPIVNQANPATTPNASTTPVK